MTHPWVQRNPVNLQVDLYNNNVGYTLGLFSLFVAVKLKPEIVSQGELKVNLERNCRVRRARQTTI